MTRRKSKAVCEFGDFQTPDALALQVTRLVRERGIRPRFILEPSCGRGAFLTAAASVFPETERIVGVDINAHHLDAARARRVSTSPGSRLELHQGDFFQIDWSPMLREGDGPWLILGNPPWVTSAALGALGSFNLPEKSNFHGRAGLEALTGKSNFDISEWMLLRYLDWLEGAHGAIAVLCKTAVARKILTHTWKRGYPMKSAWLHGIDAPSHFGAAVDACFFMLETDPGSARSDCEVFDCLEAAVPSRRVGFQNGLLIENAATFADHAHLCGPEPHYVWRSGIKHDCAKVMELKADADGYRNGFGELVAIEEEFLFPMLKSSDIGNRRNRCPRLMLVTQSRIGDDTARIRERAPKTWRYLQAHADALGRRASSIYRGKPPFSIFGVGDYSFAPWKVAISGFYKRLDFRCVGPIDGRPAMFDDTIYLLPCGSEDEARFLQALLNSEPARRFYESMVHWPDKRPITIDLLRRLSIARLAAALGRDGEYRAFAASAGERHRSIARTAA